MSLDAVIQATQVILSGVDDVGNVYPYRRWAANEAAFLKLFKDGNKILAWCITRESTEIDEFEQGSHDYHQIVIRGWMGTQDANNTEAVFQRLVESIRDAFQVNRTLTISGNEGAEFSDRIRVRTVNYVKFGEYLCHYAELLLKVKDIVTP